MKKEKIKIVFIWGFALIPVFCVLLDLICNTIYGIQIKVGEEHKRLSFDACLAEQTIYFSVWTAVVTSSWGTVNIINYFKKENKIKWGQSENTLTMIFIYNFISTLIYTFTMFIARDTVSGFSNWYNIIKSVFEHWIIPLMLIVYYFSFRESKNLDLKKYAKHKAWLNLILPFIYACYITLRVVLLSKYDMFGEVARTFPYEQMDPYNETISKNADVRIFITGLCMSSALIATYLLSIVFEFVSVKSCDKLQKRFFVNGVLKIKR